MGLIEIHHKLNLAYDITDSSKTSIAKTCYMVTKIKLDITQINTGFGLGLWCLTPLSTIFQIYRGGQFY
jgi:hypothetical protein